MAGSCRTLIDVLLRHLDEIYLQSPTRFVVAKSPVLCHKLIGFNTLSMFGCVGSNEICKGKVVFLTVKACMGSSGVAPLVLNLGTGWKLMVNLTPQPLYPREISLVPTE